MPTACKTVLFLPAVGHDRFVPASKQMAEMPVSAVVALTREGTVTSWGGIVGDVAQPADLANVVAVACGGYFTMALLRDGAPQLTIEPWDQSVATGANANLVAKVVGLPSTHYQWQFNGSDIAGATLEGLSISNVQPQHAGFYMLSASNELGQVTSRRAKLLVAPASPPSTNATPRIESFSVGGDAYVLRVRVTPGVNYTLRASDNLVNWVSLQSRTPLASPLTFTITNPPALRNRFYRVFER